MLLEGEVVSGAGEAAGFVEMLSANCPDVLGMALYPGTLNVRLDAEYLLSGEYVAIAPERYGGAQAVYAKPCVVMGHSAWILRPEANMRGDGLHPLNVIEIASGVRLRDALGLHDGSRIEIVAEND